MKTRPNSMIVAAIAALLWATVSCATARTPHKLEAGYWRCENVTAALAQESLKSAGYEVETEGTAKLHTGWKQLPSGFLPAGGKPLLDMSLYYGAVDVLEAGGGVDWKANYKKTSAMQSGVRFEIGDGTNLAPLGDDQVRSPEMRQVLNNLRKAVCGGDPFFLAGS